MFADPYTNNFGKIESGTVPEDLEGVVDRIAHLDIAKRDAGSYLYKSLVHSASLVGTVGVEVRY
jgi:hypothetical protein